MALIQCTKCKNEYDNYDSKCPYCGTPAPMLSNAKPVALRFVIIALVVAGALVALGEAMPVKEWVMQLADFSQRDQISQPQSAREEVLPSRPQEAVLAEFPQRALDDESLLISVSAVDEYTTRLVQLLRQEGSSIRLNAPPVEQPKNVFTYTVSPETTVVLKFDNQGEKLESITLNDTQERTFALRMRGIQGSFFAAALSKDVSVQDMNAQLNYLLQLTKASGGNEESYRFQGHKLSAHYSRNKKEISIKLTM